MRARFALERTGAVVVLCAALIAAGAGALQWSTVATDTAAADEAEAWATTGMVGAGPEEIALARADADRARADLTAHRRLAVAFFGGSIVLALLGVGAWVAAGRRRRRQTRALA